jgi:uncharacterized protein with PIN domain
MPHTAYFRFYEELNDFLPLEKRKVQFLYEFDKNPSVKDAIEALGAPHTEVDLILVNGRSVGFDHHLVEGDDVSVFPVFESIDITPLVRLREKPLRDPKFIGDVHLGKLSRLLRLLGFDTLYRNDYDDPAIVELAVAQKRCILTRDRGILKRKAVTHGYCLRSTVPLVQAHEVVRRFDLKGLARPFTRCLECNGIVVRVEKKSVLRMIPEKTRECYGDFHKCESCGKIYWQGSHFDVLRQTVGDLLETP